MQDVPDVTVKDKLIRPHPLVLQAKQELRKATPFHGRLETRGVLDVRVSKQSLDRALRIMDALIRASIARGWTWRVADSKTTIQRDKCTPMPVAIKERCFKSPPDDPKARLLDFEWKPSGELRLTVDLWAGEGVRNEWAESRATRMEDRLGDVLVGFDKLLAGRQVIEAEWEEARRRRQEESKREEAKKQRAKEAAAFRHTVLKATRNWKRAQEIRELCAAMASASDNQPPEEAAATMDWVRRALEVAWSLDPLSDTTT